MSPTDFVVLVVVILLVIAAVLLLLATRRHGPRGANDPTPIADLRMYFHVDEKAVERLYEQLLVGDEPISRELKTTQHFQTQASIGPEQIKASAARDQTREENVTLAPKERVATVRMVAIENALQRRQDAPFRVDLTTGDLSAGRRLRELRGIVSLTAIFALEQTPGGPGEVLRLMTRTQSGSGLDLTVTVDMEAEHLVGSEIRRKHRGGEINATIVGQIVNARPGGSLQLEPLTSYWS